MTYRIEVGDCRDSLRKMAEEGVKVQMCVTSPPYFGLRSYLPDDHPDKALEMGSEQAPEQFIAALVEVFRLVHDVLADDGTLWINIGDSYCSTDKWGGGKSGNSGKHRVAEGGDVASWAVRARKPEMPGIKPKELIGIPWMLAFALRADGWYLRQEIIWHKPNPMPEPVTDRCTKSHEQLFLLTKRPNYYFDHLAIKEAAYGGAPGNKKPLKGVGDGGANDKHRTRGGLHEAAARARAALAAGEPMTRNKRTVWSVATRPYSGAHFATFPPGLIEPCVLAGSRPGDLVLDPFGGSGTTAGVALAHGRGAVLCELNEASAALVADRVASVVAGLAPKPTKTRKKAAPPTVAANDPVMAAQVPLFGMGA